MLFKTLAAAALAIAAAVMPAAAQEFIAGIPRNEALIIQGPAAQNADWFNLWAPGGGATNNGLQQLTADTFWFINPEGTGDAAWTNALAADRPVYNDDFTQMTVKLKEGIYWSDGVEFTADDVVFTVQTQIDHPGMNWSAPFTVNVASVEATDRNTVVFNLKRSNSRFHTLFTVRWNAAWIMPKHVFETVDDPLTFNANPPVSLSAYVMHSYDSAGNWVIWKLRDDWQRTSIGMELTEAPQVKYVVYRNAGNPDARVIEQLNHNLDVINDIAPEGMFTIARDAADSTATWFPGFPFAHPDPTLPSVLFNHQVAPFDNKDVRWALATMIDIRAGDILCQNAYADFQSGSIDHMAFSGQCRDEIAQELLERHLEEDVDGNGNQADDQNVLRRRLPRVVPPEVTQLLARHPHRARSEDAPA